MPLVSSLIRASSAARRSGVAKCRLRSRATRSCRRAPRAAADHLLDRAAPAGAREIVGVLAFRQQREAQALAGLEQRQREFGGAIGRLLAGACRRRNTGSARPPSSTAARAGFRSARCRAAPRSPAKPAVDHGDDVDIAFDHHQRRAVMRGLPRGREIVEIVALVKQRGFRRIQIFRRRRPSPARGRRTRSPGRANP